MRYGLKLTSFSQTTLAQLTRYPDPLSLTNVKDTRNNYENNERESQNKQSYEYKLVIPVYDWKREK